MGISGKKRGDMHRVSEFHGYAGMIRNGPDRLTYLNACSSGNGITWGLEGVGVAVTLLDDVSHWRWPLGPQIPKPGSVSLSACCLWIWM